MKQILIFSLLLTARIFAGELQILEEGFKFTEGPAADAAGNVYFSDLRASRIYVHTEEGQTKVFREQSGGANGLFFDPAGNLLVCEGDNKRVTSISPDGKVTILASEYNGKAFNKPNDLWPDPKGGIYFTDPIYGRVPKTQDGEHVYYIAPDRSKVTRVIDDFKRPNGIIGTPDGKSLYVADAGASKVWKFSIQPDGMLSNKTLFTTHGSDGMTLDVQGNLYITENSVLVFSPEGKQIDEIKTPARPTNVTFGGKDGTTLFITARTHLCSIQIGSEMTATAEIGNRATD